MSHGSKPNRVLVELTTHHNSEASHDGFQVKADDDGYIDYDVVLATLMSYHFAVDFTVKQLADTIKRNGHAGTRIFDEPSRNRTAFFTIDIDGDLYTAFRDDNQRREFEPPNIGVGFGEGTDLDRSNVIWMKADEMNNDQYDHFRAQLKIILSDL